MSTIINLRGTNASGKSTAVRSVMDYYGVAEELVHPVNGKIIGYILNNNWAVLGRYETDCGGCDTLPGFDAIRKLVHQCLPMIAGGVLFEGVLWSTVFKSTAELIAELPQHKFILATLDTPVETCVARLRHRNEAKAARERKPVKYSNDAGLRSKHDGIYRTHLKLKQAGFDARWVDHKNAPAQLLTWIDGRLCPSCGKPGFNDADNTPDEAFFHQIVGNNHNNDYISCESDHAD